jgi:hypothetical protein
MAQISMEAPNVLVTHLHVDTLVHWHAGLGDTIDIDATDEEDGASCPPTAPYVDPPSLSQLYPPALLNVMPMVEAEESVSTPRIPDVLL